jgi:hypothetical protein
MDQTATVLIAMLILMAGVDAASALLHRAWSR